MLDEVREYGNTLPLCRQADSHERGYGKAEFGFKKQLKAQLQSVIYVQENDKARQPQGCLAFNYTIRYYPQYKFLR